ncbi:MAG: 16S rRNA (adenine(1518)-N(6)/adenine(1519)-N(6))-dimethyltransferase RsmA [Candidatus Eremiobacteraeota bacterium]|nr:16S rRNA (adenine(1518)-N(6)/adenine(1519)-N(6))-dimethyltransferase RsmA [Candidatus Eremiobacteraeota bacterium]
MHLKKYRGQHLLPDKNMLAKIVNSANIKPDDNIIEIGPGTGLLTEILAQKAGKVIAFEIDRDFENNLRLISEKHQNLEVRFIDFLKWDIAEFMEGEAGKWRVMGNIPYNITSPIIEKLIEKGRENITDVHLLIQKEVAQRIVSPPGVKEYGRISVFVQFFADVKILFNIPPSVFIPPPKVDSSLISIKFKDLQEKYRGRDFQKTFFTIVRAAFEQRRKQLQKALRGSIPGFDSERTKEILEGLGMEPKRRGETLSVDEYIEMTEYIIKTRK